MEALAMHDKKKKGILCRSSYLFFNITGLFKIKRNHHFEKNILLNLISAIITVEKFL